jgi:hypothetical protein
MPDEQVPPPYGYPYTPWQSFEDPARPAPGATGWPPGSPWPNQGGSPQPPQRRARWAATAVIVALAAALISGSAGFELGLQHSRIGAAVQNLNAVAFSSCPAGTASTAPSAISPAGTALLARLLPVPKGDEQVATVKQGVLSLSDYMQQLFYDDPAEQARLVARCFQTAVVRTWLTPGGTTVSVWLIQFGSHADARSYTLFTEQGDASAARAGAAKFTVAGVADSMGFADPTLDKYGDTLTRVLGDAGNTSIIVHVFIPAKTNDAASSQVLKAQNARLSAGSA